MAHGAPDWWGAMPGETVYGSTDIAELAVRLGSNVKYDRRGNVIFTDSFAQGLSGWSTGGSEAACRAYPVTFPQRYSGMGMMIHVAGAGNEWTDLGRSVQMPVLGAIGLEFSWCTDAELADWEAYFDLHTGTHLCYYGCRYYASDKILRVRTQTGWDQVAVTDGVREDFETFNTTKMVVDILNGEYVRILFNDAVYLPVGKAPKCDADVDIPRLKVRFLVHNETGATCDVVIDDVIVTQNEPVD